MNQAFLTVLLASELYHFLSHLIILFGVKMLPRKGMRASKFVNGFYCCVLRSGASSVLLSVGHTERPVQLLVGGAPIVVDVRHSIGPTSLLLHQLGRLSAMQKGDK